MGEPWKKDIRALFAGSDPARHIREGAADLMAKAMVNGIKREHEALKHSYTSTPTLMVQVEQVRHEPPLWRMRTMRPVVAGGECVSVEDSNPDFLEAEMRMRCKQALISSGYFDDKPYAEQADIARKWVAEMKIEREPLILLRDSQRHHSEWNR